MASLHQQHLFRTTGARPLVLRPPSLLLHREPQPSPPTPRRDPTTSASPGGGRTRARPSTTIAANASSSSSSSTPPQTTTTVWGASILVAGTAVGAGILALPSATASAGFAPSAVALTGGAAYSVATGLLIAEVALRAARRRQRRRRKEAEPAANDAAVSIQSMASASLGPTGASVASAAYLFLHYALLVAYIAKAGEILAGGNADAAAPPLAGALFASALGALCFFAPPAKLDAANGAMFAGTVAAFAALCVLAAAGGGAGGGDASSSSSSSFAHLLDSGADPRAWASLPAALPLIALAFVYHNVVPVVANSLGGDSRRIRPAITLGVAIPWLMLLAWEAVTLNPPAAAVGGPAEGAGATAAAIIDPLARLAASSDGPAGALIAAFSLGAVATSFLGFTLGLTTFFDDALPALRRYEEGQQQGGGGKENDDEKNNSARPPASAFALTLVPPVVLAALSPGAFYAALDAAGTYGVLTLFGLLPPAMVWAERYGGAGGASTDNADDEDEEKVEEEELLPGGKAALLVVAGMAGAVMANSAAADVAAALAGRS